MRIRTIKVVPNPYSALDADGRAVGVVSRENSSDTYVGASLDVDESRKVDKHYFTFSTEPVELPATAYYMRRIQDRSLLPADLETAKFAGIDAKNFETPESALAKEKERVSGDFEEVNGRLPAFALQPKKNDNA